MEELESLLSLVVFHQKHNDIANVTATAIEHFCAEQRFLSFICVIVVR